MLEIQHRSKTESNPFVVGKPVPLTEAELAQMRKDRANGAVLAGYTIPVTLQKESKDKTPFDVGIFRQRIQLKTKGADPNLEVSIQVGVHGTILGDLRVVGDDPGPVKLGSFYRNQDDVQREVLVESAADVTALELDRQRTPDFLGVAFPAPPEKIGGRKTWRLNVKWLPQSQAGGAFPATRTSTATAPCTFDRCTPRPARRSRRASASPSWGRRTPRLTRAGKPEAFRIHLERRKAVDSTIEP